MRELLVALASANEQTISDSDLRYITSFVDSLGIALLSSDRDCLTTAPLTSIVQRFSFWTVIGNFLGLIAERISGEESSCLVLTIDDRNVGLNIPPSSPNPPGGRVVDIGLLCFY
jgi:hypothetical protein